MSSPDFVIVGAGAVGAAAAYELVACGAGVSVLERSPVASGCSYGSAGLISPSHSEALASPDSIRHGLAWIGRRDSPFHVRPRLEVIPWLARFAAASLPKRSAAASATLRALTTAGLESHGALVRSGLSTSFARRGILGVYESESSLEAACLGSRAMGLSEVRAVSAREARELLPTLSPQIAGGLYYPNEAHCDPAVFVDALLDAARDHGAAIRTGVEVLGLHRRNDRITELQTTDGPIRGGTILLAAGAWTRELMRDVGVHIPLEGGKGYHVEISSTSSHASVPAFLEDARVTATPLNGRMRFTGALELSGLDLHVDPVRVQAIDRVARRAVSVPATARPVHIWRGLRPCAPDGMPIIGRAEEIENLYIATGHAMLGIALAPVTAEILSDLLRGRSPRFPIDHFAPARFRRPWPIMQNHTEKQNGRN